MEQNWGTVIGTQIQNLLIRSPDPEEVYDRSIRQPLERLCERQPCSRIFILVDALDEALTPGETCTIRSACRLGRLSAQRPLSPNEPPGAESAR